MFHFRALYKPEQVMVRFFLEEQHDISRLWQVTFLLATSFFIRNLLFGIIILCGAWVNRMGGHIWDTVKIWVIFECIYIYVYIAVFVLQILITSATPYSSDK